MNPEIGTARDDREERMIDVIVDNRIRMQQAALSEDFLTSLRQAFTYANPDAEKALALGRRFHGHPPKIKLWTAEGTSISVPRGGMQKVRDLFDEYDLDYQVIDRMCRGNVYATGSYVDNWQLSSELFPEHRLVSRDYQDEMVQAALQFKQCLLRAPTGSGKTSAVLKLISSAQVPALVIMWDTGLLKQWQERIESELGIPVADQGLIQGQRCVLKPITLAMQQTINRWGPDKWSKIRGVFGLVACDEVQRYAASTFLQTVNEFDALYRVGVSANERRKDRKEFIIYDMFGPVRCEVSKKRLVDRAIIHDVEMFVVPTNFAAPWYVDVRGRDMPITAWRRLLDEMERDKERNQLAVKLTRDCVDAGMPTLTFTQGVEHALTIHNALSTCGVGSGMAIGGKRNSGEFDATVRGLRSGDLKVGCGTFGKLGVGHDIPTVAAGVAITPVHSNESFLDQVKGRICRASEGKSQARIVVLWDRLVFGDVPLRNFRKWNNVTRVWDSFASRWFEIDEYLKRNRFDDRREATQEAPANIFTGHRGFTK